jgi:biopolymer transport protein ExbD
MKVPSFEHDRETKFDQAMTPMIVVVFLLLIFFVCASVGRMAESLMSVDLSSGSIASTDVKPIETKPAWVTEVWLKLNWDETSGRTLVEMNGREFDQFEPLEADLRKLAELSSDSPIILDIDGRVPAGDVIRVDDACRAAGFQSINYATDPEKLQANRER